MPSKQNRRRQNGDPGPLTKGFKAVRNWANAFRDFVIRRQVIVANGWTDTGEGLMPPPLYPPDEDNLTPFIWRDNAAEQWNVGVTHGFVIGRGSAVRQFLKPHLPKIGATSDGIGAVKLDKRSPNAGSVEIKPKHKYLVLVIEYGEAPDTEELWPEICRATFFPNQKIPRNTRTKQYIEWAEIRWNGGEGKDEPFFKPDSIMRGNFFGNIPKMAANLPPCTSSAGPSTSVLPPTSPSTSSNIPPTSLSTASTGSGTPRPDAVCLEENGTPVVTLYRTPNDIFDYEDDDGEWQCSYDAVLGKWFLFENFANRGDLVGPENNPVGNYGNGYALVSGECPGSSGSAASSGSLVPPFEVCLLTPSGDEVYGSIEVTLTRQPGVGGNWEYHDLNGGRFEYVYKSDPLDQWVLYRDDVTVVAKGTSPGDPLDPQEVLTNGYSVTNGACPTSSSAGPGPNPSSQAASSQATPGSSAPETSLSTKTTWILPVKNNRGETEHVALSPIESKRELFADQIIVPVNPETGEGVAEMDSYYFQVTEPRYWGEAHPLKRPLPRGSAAVEILSSIGGLPVIRVTAPRPSMLDRIRKVRFPASYAVTVYGSKKGNQGDWVGSPTRNPGGPVFTEANMKANAAWYSEAHNPEREGFEL